ncbi:non-ribosomal peptide synthetase [Mycolicibacterium chitae]|uniref:Amino acid adenylation domain-containing protein n=1 Tax=Mycolicibacterium chitae TaxID=1792 RepID=A0A448I4G6_MYCCI|nr:non-ribosomal peptide synthetase [Mycolicibacterium chitae]MCV7107986.1 amino acid adenylation domain-containing protein [Mycolicibacterium chitae]BBZ03723.1 non-ribosomal peptide synthetase [Mycolicibacterium chitae]VEG47378.1 amino acid adenylation domain-containing protein [Mycolicibacterium chitae]
MTSTDQNKGAPAIEDVIALSPLQQGLFSMTTLAGTDPDGRPDPYVIAMAADVTGTLDAGLLRDCAALMLARHPNLRASFFRGNLSRTVQVIPAAVEVPWTERTASGDEEAAALEAAERARPFDLEHGPAIRFLLIELPEQRWRLAVMAHHIIIDGWSLPLFVGELITLYRAGGDAAALPNSPRPYRDYIGWLASRDQQASRAVWQRHLAGLAGPTLLTPALTDVEPTPGLPRRTEVRLDRAATTALAEAARARRVTLNTLVQMAWAAVLSVFTDRHDVVFGMTVSGRPDELSGVESMVGLFVNTVPLRISLDPRRSVGEQCTALQRTAAELREHSYLAHNELRGLAGVGELFDTLLVYENFPPGGLVGGGEFTANGATFTPAALESLSHFPVTIAAHLTDGELTVLVETLEGALGPVDEAELGRRVIATAEDLITQWDNPLRDVNSLFAEEAEAIRAAARTGPDTAAMAGSPVAAGVHLRFAQIAARHPDAVALSHADGELSYAELDRAADRLAAALVARGVADEAPVAINLPRGPQYVIAMFAVLKAGGMIVPLDPAMPAERIADIIDQSAARVVIDADWPAESPEPPADYRPARTGPEHAAYAVFTSGTTGKPKGVIGTHGAVLSYAADHAENVLRPAATRLSRPLRIAHAWSFTFDAAWQPLAGLLDGHSVHIVGDAVQRDADALVDVIDRHGVDLIDTTPSMFAQLYNVGLLTQVPLTVLALGGEAIGIGTWRNIRAACERTGMTAYNCYGPTETTVEAVVAAIADHPQPTIGRPTTDTRAQVLDSWLRPVPDGVAGELYLSGAQVTRGYLGRPAETAGRFVADPANPGARMYRTGDVVRRNPDATLQYLGRSDDQVKIRGYRVEPGEITAVLLTHPLIQTAHVAVRAHRSGPRLIAYVATGGTEVPVAEVRAMLTTRLPRYLVPHRIVVLDELPLTSHGKVDERALAAADGDIDDGPVAKPETETEAALAEVVAELLETPVVDVAADLLSMGLDSIVALSVVQAARRRGIPLRARLMLECGSIRELAAAIDAEVESTAATVDNATDGSPIPVLPNVHWLYEYGSPRRLAQTEAIRLPQGTTGAQLRAVLAAIVAGHEVLRCRLDRATMTLVPDPEPADVFSEVDAGADLAATVVEQTAKAVESLDPERGRLLSAVWVREDGGPGVLVLTAHVLALDPASWRILIGELDAGWHALADGHQPVSVREHTGYRQWSHRLGERALKLDTCEFWVSQLRGPDPDLGARRIRPQTDRAAHLQVSLSMSGREVAERLVGAAVPMTDLLAAAASRMVTAWRHRRGQDSPTPLLALETHGRAEAVVDPDGSTDIGETVGLFSAIYPVRVAPEPGLPRIPGDGIDYGLLRYLRADTGAQLREHAEPQIMLNYLGRTEAARGGSAELDRTLLAGASLLPEPELAVLHELTVTAAVMLDATEAPVLATQWRALPDIFTADDIAVLQSLWEDALSDVAREVAS